MARGVYLAFGSIQCFLDASIAPESSDFKSVGCKTVNLEQLEIFMFYEGKKIDHQKHDFDKGIKFKILLGSPGA